MIQIETIFAVLLLIISVASGVVIFIRATMGAFEKTNKDSAMPGLFTLWALAIVSGVAGLLILGIIPKLK
jgi:hypothetical protein